MSERAGSVRDARHLSGADIGRHFKGPGAVSSPGPIIVGIYHDRDSVTVELSVGSRYPVTVQELHPHDPVTITGADA